jgi:hypothetical protein
MIIAADIEGAECVEDAHYNMGYDDEGRQKGYGYGHSFTSFPRLRFIDRVYKTERNRRTRTWYVDGTECADLAAAIEALNKPAILTEDEQAALALIPSEFVSYREMIDRLAGCEKPDGAIMPDTPHSKAHDVAGRLRAKGVVEMGRHPDRSDGQPWSEIVPEHLRWSPTIRRMRG